MDLHVPQVCVKCGSRMIFRGVGEYQCENCGFLQYDDYGKIRLCIEAHPGVTLGDAESMTGVSQRTIRKLLKEGRIMLTEDSKVMLQCENCGKKIRYGRLCINCEKKLAAKIPNFDPRNFDSERLHGYALVPNGDKGQKRYKNGHDGQG